ncbi:hypothetical protein B0H16DRAFT_1776905 [Mycena metata]|uniref:Alpha-ketoglutarate-dependent dioxygenase AlkB-like domain-containing protein n=1 Tax=Mycena metata TaxID=1033252 RepID=A0AAD7JQX0_9AGAR|nr:hypothetical protein B0H16DRAFT_1776905 [Mycena metata]
MHQTTMYCPKECYDKRTLKEDPLKEFFDLRELQGRRRRREEAQITEHIAEVVEQTLGGLFAVETWLRLTFGQSYPPSRRNTILFVNFFWHLALGSTTDATKLLKSHSAAADRDCLRARRTRQKDSRNLYLASQQPQGSSSGSSNDVISNARLTAMRPRKFRRIEVEGQTPSPEKIFIRIPALPLLSGNTLTQNPLSSQCRKIPRNPGTPIKQEGSDVVTKEFPLTFPKTPPFPFPPIVPIPLLLPSPSSSTKCEDTKYEDEEMFLCSAASETPQHLYDWPELRMGFPPVWSESRQEICETLPYFRSFHGGVYQNGGVAKGYLLGGFGSEGDCFLHGGRLIISHGGGGGNETVGIDKQVKDQRGGDKSVRALINNCGGGTPVLLLVDEHYSKFPLNLGEKNIYSAVLGFYTIIATWAESRCVDGTDVVRYKFAFRWCKGQGDPWWIKDPKEPSESMDTPKYSAPHVVHRCDACGNTSPCVFSTGWACLNPQCAQFWKWPDGQPSVGFDYNPEFLDLREPPELASGFDARIVPPPPVFDSVDEFTTSFEYTRGWHCQKCGRVSSRSAWEHYECAYCRDTRSIGGKVHIAASLKCENSLPRAFRHTDFTIAENSGIIRGLAKKYDGDFGGWGMCQSFVLPNNRGTIYHIRGSETLNEDANRLLEDYQTQASAGALLFRRHPLKKHMGIRFSAFLFLMPTYLLLARGKLLSSYFSQNAGKAYQYVGSSSHTVPLQDACPAVRDAHRLIQNRVAAVLEGSHRFNEVLSVAYLEQQSMSYHSDNEHGLGPVIAGLSLGSPAVMNFRLAAKLAPGARHRIELSVFLQHGDVLVMEGTGVQTDYQHTVIPQNFRIAVTARQIGAGNVTALKKKKPIAVARRVP